MYVCVLSAAGIGGPDWYREKEKSVRSNLSGACLLVFLCRVLLVEFVSFDLNRRQTERILLGF